METSMAFYGFLTTTRLVIWYLIPCFLIVLALLWIPIVPLSSIDFWLGIFYSLFYLVIWLLCVMPMKRCCVCNKTRADKVILHVFPNPAKEPNRFKLWVNAIGGNLYVLDDRTIFGYYRVCHIHFNERDHTWSNRLSPDAVPRLHLQDFRTSLPRKSMQDITNENNSGVQPSLSTVQPSISTVQPSTSSAKHAYQLTSELSDQHALLTSQPVKMVPKHKLKRSTIIYNPEVAALSKKIKRLQNSKAGVVENLKRALILSENISFQKSINKFTSPAKIFTLLQFREIRKQKLGRRFTKEEKVMALAVYKQGPKSYRWLRRFFILPAPLTLSRMITRAALKPGLNENLFQQLKTKVDKMKENDKLCILLFDEVALTPHFDYSKRRDCISGFVDNGEYKKRKIADHALVFMIRGLFKNYKQPLAYTFCASTTPSIELVSQIKNIIRKIKSVGLKVIATVCDQSTTNVSAIHYLINQTKSEYLRKGNEIRHNIFEIDGDEIVPLFDPPHLIKGIRNNLLQSNLQANLNGRAVTGKWDHILQLYKKDGIYDGIRLIPKLTDRHVIPQKISKMKVKCATQVFSRTVAGYMGSLAYQGVLPQECEETAVIIKFFDELFDSFNGSYNNFNKNRGKVLLGPVTPKSNHKKIWDQAKNVLSTMTFLKNDGKSVVVPSIKNWLHTIDNIVYLVDVLQKKYKLTSLWMRHFNQDPLENFFGSIRSHGYRNNSPSCASFEAAFASLLINNLSSTHSLGSNCEMDSCITFKSLKKLFFMENEMSTCTTEVDFNDIDSDYIFKDLNIKIGNLKVRTQLEYVTGYVLRKLKIKCTTCRDILYSKENTSISTINVREYFENKTCLTYPSHELIKCFSNIQDVVIKILRQKSDLNNVIQYINTVLSIIIDYDFLKCEEHKKCLITELEKIAIKFFVYNWCKNTNKLLIGSTTDFDIHDDIQICSYNYCKKRFKK